MVETIRAGRAVRAVVALVLGLAIALSTGRARADLKVTEAGVVRSVSDRDSGHFPLYVSRSDCTDGDVFTFPVTVTNFKSSDVIEAWAGEGSADCTTVQNRQTMPICKKIVSKTGTAVQNGVVNFDIKSSTLAESLDGVSDCKDSNGSSSARKVNLYFLLITQANEDVVAPNFALWDKTQVDLVGPEAPTQVEAKPAENGLSLEWNQTEGNDVTGYRLYCEPAGAAAAGGAGGAGSSSSTSASTTTGAGGGGGGAGGAAGGAGGSAGGAGGGSAGSTSASSASSAGGGAAGGSGSGDCTSSVLEPGKLPPDGVKERTEVEKTGEGLAGGLSNGTRYACGVVAIDALKNEGPLSELSCGVPEPVDDFFELYRRYGGEAGGGFCDCEAPGAGRSPAGLAGVGCLFALVLVARRRRRSRSGGMS